MLEWIVSACVLILIVMLCRKLLKGKISCWVQYSLWLLVAVRLLVPVSPLESALSIANLLPESWTGQETGGMPVGNGVGADRRAQPGQGGIYWQQERPEMLAPGAAAPAISAQSQLKEGGFSLTEGRSSSENRTDSPSGNSIYGETAESKVWRVIGAVWLTGSCLLALWLLGVNGSFRWRVRRSRLPFEVSEELLRQLQRECRQGSFEMEGLGIRFNRRMSRSGKSSMRGKIRRQLPVYVTDQINAPCMYGLLHPAIYITARTAEDSQVLAMVLCHEQMHYCHGDHIWSAVRMLCLCVHWYNPLVWTAVRLSRQDGELACDEGVLRQLGEKNRKRYGEALLALAMEQRPRLRSSLNLATSMSDTRKQLGERLSALVTMPRMAAGTAVLVFLLILVLMACTLTGRADAHEENPVSDKTAVLKMTLQNDRKTMDMASQGSVRHTANLGRVDSQGTGTEAGGGSDAGNRQEVEPGNGTGAGDGYGAGTGSEVDDTEQGTEAGDGMEPEPDYRPSWVLAEEYTGYLDEVDAWERVYRNQDYDGDGLTDRIYQDVVSEPGVMKMRVEFGNGEVLSFDTYFNGALMVQSLDLDGEGSRELLFTKPNDFSTNPMSIGTDILLFTRQGNGYRQVEVALEEAPEEYGPTPWEVNLAISYSKEDDSHIRVSWRVPGAEGNLGKTQTGLRPADEGDMAYYEPLLGGRHYAPAYSAELIQEQDAYLRLYFEGLYRSGDEIWVDMALRNGELIPVGSAYASWDSEQGAMVCLDLDNAGTAYDNWNVQNLAYYEEDGYPVAAVTEGNVTWKLTYVETSWSLSVVEAQFSKEVLYWACQALQELEQWTGTQVTEVCYCVSESGDFYFSLTPQDMVHSRTFYSRCYNGLSFCRGEVIESIGYSTDMDVWYSPVKQYVTPPGYDKMTAQERLIWFFERSAIARGSKVEEIIYPWEGEDYLIRTDQGTYYDFAATAGVDTLGKGLSLTGPYDGYPQH